MKYLTLLLALLFGSTIAAQKFDYTWKESTDNTTLTVDIPAKDLPEKIDFVSVFYRGSANVKRRGGSVIIGNIKIDHNELRYMSLERYIYNPNGRKKVRWGSEFQKTLADAIIDELTFYLDGS